MMKLLTLMKIMKNGNNEIMKAVGTAVNSTTSLETFAQIVEQTNGLKDFFKNAWGLATGTA